jgi:bis(5'-adenosyl)-triphosphatase
LTVQRVGRVIERIYGASSLNIAIQDGVDAGQSVQHVHTHVIPRWRKDLDNQGGTDAIYGLLDGEEGNLDRIQRGGVTSSTQAVNTTQSIGTKMEAGNNNTGGMRSRRSDFPSVDNESRTPRSEEDMAQEAHRLAAEMEKEDQTVDS